MAPPLAKPSPWWGLFDFCWLAKSATWFHARPLRERGDPPIASCFRMPGINRSKVGIRKQRRTLRFSGAPLPLRYLREAMLIRALIRELVQTRLHDFNRCAKGVLLRSLLVFGCPELTGPR